MTGRVHVVMAADAAYLKGLEVAKASMIESASDPSRLEFHIFGEESGLEQRIRREFGTYKGSPMAFLRLYLGELLPDVNWVVYSDVDTLWGRDVLELAALFDERKTIQWVRDLKSTAAEFVSWCRENDVGLDGFRPDDYCCSGVCIINLKQWRERDVLGRCRDFAARYGFPQYADQDILNALLHPEAGILPEWWDVQIPDPENASCCVLHLPGVGRCFKAPYHGKVVQYRYWEHVACGTPFKRPFALPFYLRDWMIRACLPFSSEFLRDRIRRYFGWRWYLRNLPARQAAHSCGMRAQ